MARPRGFVSGHEFTRAASAADKKMMGFKQCLTNPKSRSIVGSRRLPGLKPRVKCRHFQGPEGPCSFRSNSTKIRQTLPGRCGVFPSTKRCFLFKLAASAVIALALLFALPALAQYPGEIAKPDANAPDLRAVAVFEWTGDEAHPKTARMVPICIYDGQELNDAAVYLAQPEPLALQSDVEYQLQRDGKPVGLFDIDTSAREQGGWVGYGKWKPPSLDKKAPAQVAKVDEEDDSQSDVPILHRKHHDDSTGGSGSASGSGTNSDPGSASSSGSAAPAPDPDRPTLHKTDDSSVSSGSSSDKSGGSKLKKKKHGDDDEGYVSDVASAADPNRPHLIPGKPADFGRPAVPNLLGLPPDMKQTVAVSDAVDHAQHLWNYTWANPDDEDKMKSAMEDLARSALGLNPPPAPKPTSKSVAARRRVKPVTPPPPAPLLDEHFRVFQLAYDYGATLVLSAHTGGTGADQKFVTLIAQPDLYGGVAVLVKNVTDAASLDLTPRMRIVDAVDAEADNRGELLFELRGETERQFALYRVLRGDATRIFITAPESFAVSSGPPDAH
ncbi:MAG TPA: hypothetical protein VGG45_15930 [Terracidiphilus sp.]